MLVRFTHKAIIFVMVIFMTSTVCAMKTFDEMKDDARKIAREIIEVDRVIQDDRLFSEILCTFINELPESKDAKLFLPKFTSFKNDSHWKVKSFQNFLTSLISIRIKPVFECLCDLIKRLPENYVQKYIFDWLERSLRCGKQLYFQFFLNEYGQYCDIKKIQDLSGKLPYSALPLESKGRYDACKKFLSRQLGQEARPNTNSGLDYDSDSDDDMSDVYTDDWAAHVLVRLSKGPVLIGQYCNKRASGMQSA